MMPVVKHDVERRPTWSRLRAQALGVGTVLGLTLALGFGMPLAAQASSVPLDARAHRPVIGTGSPASNPVLDRTWVDEQLATNAVEYAGFVRTHPPDRFAYGEQVARTWRLWWTLSPGATPPASTAVTLVGWSLAQLLHGGYEALLGRFTEALARGQATPEDLWAARMAQQEAQYRKTVKWYRFPVWPALHDLWVNDWPTDVSLPRQVERRYAYTSAYLVQGVVAAVIGLAVDEV